MPIPALKSMAKKSGKKLSDLERYLEDAKEQVKGDVKDKYAYIMGIVKKRAGLDEGIFKSAQLNEVIVMVPGLGRGMGGPGRGMGPRGMGRGMEPRGMGRGRGLGGGAGLGPGGSCTCPHCGYEIPHETGNPCYLEVCPECGIEMGRNQEDKSMEPTPTESYLKSEQAMARKPSKLSQRIDEKFNELGR